MRKRTLAFVTILSLVLTVFAGSLGVSAAEADQSFMTSFDTGVLDSNAWRLQSKPENTANIVNGALAFQNSGDGTVFGPQGTYKNFAMRFDLTSFDEASTWMGLTFGLPAPDTFFADPGAKLLLFTNDSAILMDSAATVINPTGGTDVTEGGNRGWIQEDYKLAEVEETLTFKFIFKDGTLSVFYKKASDPESVLDTVRAKFENLPDVAGYVNLCTTLGANFVIDNMKFFSNPDADTSIAIPAEAVPQPTTTETGTDGKTTETQQPANTGNTPADTAAVDTTATENPKTGDTSSLPLAIGLCLVSAIVLTSLKKRAVQK